MNDAGPTRWMKRIGLATLGVLIVAQAFRIDRTNPAVESTPEMPADVERVLRRACYDCHSHEVTWPWYSHVAPVSWLLAWDVREARRELNLSRWDRYDAKKKAKKLEEMVEEVEEGHMPLWYYRIVHPEARVSKEELALLEAWVAAERSR